MAGQNEGSTSNTTYPGGSELERYIRRRQQRGSFWVTIFMASTLIGIIALTALLYNVVNSAFGYVAIQNEIAPASLVRDIEAERLLSLSNLTTSEDDEVLATGIAGDPNAVGFFGYAYYQEHADELRTVAIDGVEPNAGTVESGEYPLARPLYIYSAKEVLAEKPAVATFVHFYLQQVDAVIEEADYFPASEQALAAGLADWQALTGLAEPQPPADDPIQVVGSSTVYPLTVALAEEFRAAGYGGDLTVQNVGTGAGFARFCGDRHGDVVNASRAILRGEYEACRDAGRSPAEFRVGSDALAVTVSRENSFLQDATMAELEQIFGEAERWSDVNPAWPDEPIVRYIPGQASGTFDYFIDTVAAAELSDLPKEQLVAIFEEHVSAGLMRRYESEQPFAERSQGNVYDLVVERVVEPKIQATWSLMDSIFHRSEIEAEIATIPEAEMVFRSWVTPDFIVSPQSSDPEFAGVRTAILGSLWVIAITILFSLPLGVGAALYLEEYAGDTRLNRLIETNINNLAGVPSIIYGMLGLAIFVRALEFITSGAIFGAGADTTANGRTILSAGLTLGLLILPLIIINAREAVRAVPSSLRQASFGLGATQWQTIWSHVLPNALPGILTGTILAISRAIGETAPLVVIGASTFIVVDPDGPFAKFTALPIQIYQWTTRPQDEFRNLAAAAIIVLLILLLSLNATAVILRNRFSKQLT